MNWLALNYAEGDTLTSLPGFSPSVGYHCQLASREIKPEEPQQQELEADKPE
jgi:hypothetical protein